MTIRACVHTVAVLAAVLLLSGCASSSPPSEAPTVPGSEGGRTPALATLPAASIATSPTPAATPLPRTTPSATTAVPGETNVVWSADGELRDTLFADDGTVVVTLLDWVTDRSSLMMLDAAGAVMPGWPWDEETDGGFRVALGPDSTVYVVVRHPTGDPSTRAWFLHRLDRAARELPGFPVRLADWWGCWIDAAPDGRAIVTCQNEDADTGDGSGLVQAVGPDATRVAGWPVTLEGSAEAIGFRPDGGIYVRSQRGPETWITALGNDGQVISGWPRQVATDDGLAIGGDVAVDTTGRVRLTAYDWAEGQCAPAIRTRYDVIDLDGTRPSGWPIVRDGWASLPAVTPDGSMTIVTDDGRAIRYEPDGDVAPGWPVRGIDVSVDCFSGSPVVATPAGGVVVSGTREVTLLTADGREAAGWPVDPAGRLLRADEAATPGPIGQMAPAVGARGVYVATKRSGVPWIVTLLPDGTRPAGSSHEIGAADVLVDWVRVAPTGRVWTLTTDWSNELQEPLTTLIAVADDGAPAP